MRGRAGAAIEGWSGGLADFAPARVEQLTGVAAKRIERLAREFAELQPAVAIVGGTPLAHTNGLFHALAVNALNELLGTVEQPGRDLLHAQAARLRRRAQPLGPALQAAKVVLLDGANPVHGSPKAWQVREALERVPFIASFGSFIDDTSSLADLILPDSFVPRIVGRHDARVGIDRAGDDRRRPGDEAAVPDARDRRCADRAGWQAEDADRAAVEDGGRSGEFETSRRSRDPQVRNPQIRSPQSAIRGARRMSEPRFDGDAAQFPFHFLPYVSSQFGDGSAAHLPWLQELPDPLTSAMWSSWVEINPQTAERLHIAQGDLVEVRSSQGTLRAPAMIFPGIAPEVIAMPVGQGHENFTRYASKRGVNPIAILAPVDRTGDRRAGVGGDAGKDRARRRSRRQLDHVRGRDARASART